MNTPINLLTQKGKVIKYLDEVINNLDNLATHTQFVQDTEEVLEAVDDLRTIRELVREGL